MKWIERLHYLLLGNGLSLWYLVRPWRDARERRAIISRSLTAHSVSHNATDSAVCCLFEGLSEAGGLADRLRGIVSVYDECQKRGLNFKLYFKHPFDLELFLQPSLYDWRITSDQICRDRSAVRVLVMRPLSDSQYTLARQREWMQRTFAALTRNTLGQVHIYTNASTAYGNQFQHLFTSLFKPTPRLQALLDEIQRQIGGPYISVSLRFLSLLGDFEDVVDVGTVLTEAERQELLARCVARLHNLHTHYPEHKILVNSDSQRMLEAAAALPFVYIIPGHITHLDRAAVCGDEYDVFVKTFLDFFTISMAHAVFLIREHPKMRMSGFPYAAAMLGGKTLKTEEDTEN